MSPNVLFCTSPIFLYQTLPLLHPNVTSVYLCQLFFCFCRFVAIQYYDNVLQFRIYIYPFAVSIFFGCFNLFFAPNYTFCFHLSSYAVIKLFSLVLIYITSLIVLCFIPNSVVVLLFKVFASSIFRLTLYLFQLCHSDNLHIVLLVFFHVSWHSQLDIDEKVVWIHVRSSVIFE